VEGVRNATTFSQMLVPPLGPNISLHPCSEVHGYVKRKARFRILYIFIFKF
jgi:hypothetical protein